MTVAEMGATYGRAAAPAVAERRTFKGRGRSRRPLCVTAKCAHVRGPNERVPCRPAVVPFVALQQLRQGWARLPLFHYRAPASLSSLPCWPGIDFDTPTLPPCQHSQRPLWRFSGRMPLPFGMRAAVPCVGLAGPRSYSASPCHVHMTAHRQWYLCAKRFYLTLSQCLATVG